MTGITPQIVAMRGAREEFNDLTRNMSGELVRDIQQGTVPESDLVSALVQRALKVWERCQLVIDDGTVDHEMRMA